MQSELLLHAQIKLLLKHQHEKLYPGYKKNSEIYQLAEQARAIFGNEGKSSLAKLEGLSLRTDLVTDILDFIKRQSGKKGSKDKWGSTGFGKKLLDYIENKLRPLAENLVNSSDFAVFVGKPYSKDELMLLIWLELTRSLIGHLVAHSRFN